MFVVKITELESRVANLQDDLVSVQERASHELREVRSKIQADADWSTRQLHTQIATLTRSNDSLKSEVWNLFLKNIIQEENIP